MLIILWGVIYMGRYYLYWIDLRNGKHEEQSFDTMYERWRMDKWLREKHYVTHIVYYDAETKRFGFDYAEHNDELLQEQKEFFERRNATKNEEET